MKALFMLLLMYTGSLWAADGFIVTGFFFDPVELCPTPEQSANCNAVSQAELTQENYPVIAHQQPFFQIDTGNAKQWVNQAHVQVGVSDLIVTRPAEAQQEETYGLPGLGD
ncbi:hypothetical protein [Aliagarivorans marinus]|uniref:hypothetical protein n=1 Tax=Aliagarivorans marinus TaxID=561965 RepID=UPI00041855D7|nr:hypothetical protein [Aliagarivorans marinus]